MRCAFIAGLLFHFTDPATPAARPWRPPLRPALWLQSAPGVDLRAACKALAHLAGASSKIPAEFPATTPSRRLPPSGQIVYVLASLSIELQQIRAREDWGATFADELPELHRFFTDPSHCDAALWSSVASPRVSISASRSSKGAMKYAAGQVGGSSRANDSTTTFFGDRFADLKPSVVLLLVSAVSPSGTWSGSAGKAIPDGQAWPVLHR